MNTSRREVQVRLLHEFRLVQKTTEAMNNICCTIGQGVLSVGTAQHWFDRFRNRNYELDDRPRSGQPLKVDKQYSKLLIEQGPRLKTIFLAEQLGWSHTIVQRGLNDLGTS
jgi:transposase